MTIGEALKETRKMLNLTQTEMAAGVISTAFYSKVERNEFDIDTTKLMLMLHKHGLSMSEFIKSIENKDQNEKTKLRSMLLDAYSKQDINLVRKLKEYFVINRLDNLYYLSIYLEAALIKDMTIIPTEVRIAVKDELIKNDNWTDETLILLNNTMHIFNPSELSVFIRSIIKNHKTGDPDNIRILSAICVNYLAYSYIHKNSGQTVDLAFDFLKSLPELPENVFSKIMINYYTALFDHDNEKVSEIKKLLKENNLSNLEKNISI